MKTLTLRGIIDVKVNFEGEISISSDDILSSQPVSQETNKKVGKTNKKRTCVDDFFICEYISA